MSDETWLSDQDNTAQWPSAAPFGPGSGQGENTEAVGVPSQEGMPSWASQVAGPISTSEPAAAQADAPAAEEGSPAPGAGQSPGEQPPPPPEGPYAAPAYGQPPYGQPPYGQPPSASPLRPAALRPAPLRATSLWPAPLWSAPYVSSTLWSAPRAVAPFEGPPFGCSRPGHSGRCASRRRRQPRHLVLGFARQVSRGHDAQYCACVRRLWEQRQLGRFPLRWRLRRLR